jgi:hypothetical protein
VSEGHDGRVCGVAKFPRIDNEHEHEHDNDGEGEGNTGFASDFRAVAGRDEDWSDPSLWAGGGTGSTRGSTPIRSRSRYRVFAVAGRKPIAQGKKVSEGHGVSFC